MKCADLLDIGDFLTEEIKGPAQFTCKTGQGCQFEEPAMNQLINDIFGDNAITLKCDGGECLHYTQVPGYVVSILSLALILDRNSMAFLVQRPERPDNSIMVGLSAALAGLFFIIASAAFWYMGRAAKHPEGFGQIRLPADEAQKLMTDHVPARLHFSNISYTLQSNPNNPILEGITGSVKNGQVLAIMGASGAGKSTFLDILARKQKRGIVSGEVLVNGRAIPDSEFKKVMGFVDQEDTLMSTLTVYETVLYSALLRLPREMSFEAKKFRTLETMHELGILGVKDSYIGESGQYASFTIHLRLLTHLCRPSVYFRWRKAASVNRL